MDFREVDNHADFASVARSELLIRRSFYAEYKVSRTPDAEQRPQTVAQSQHQIAPAHAGNQLPPTPGHGEKGGGRQGLADSQLGFRQSRQIRRGPSRHRRPQAISPRTALWPG